MNTPSSKESTPSGNGLLQRVMRWVMDRWEYCVTGVWQDPRRSWKVSVVKTLNLAVRSFLDSDLQVRAASLTYNTVLAIVPVLALIFAIGRGFGFQKLLQNQLYEWFPSQHQVVSTGLRFVDGYLAQASEGVFVGVGLVFLLWTMVSLLSNVEDAFNIIWDVKRGRTFWRKITDYLAIFLVLPILMICGAGLTLFMQTALKTILPFGFLTPAISVVLDCASVVITWLFFTAAYMLIPNAKVRFTNALIAGVAAGCSFQILQWLFLSGQLYVAKYNAIYGSFSFLPLFLVWMYLTWLITLIGAVICFASQNIFALSFIGQVDAISLEYRRKVTIALMALICRRFFARMEPMTVDQLAHAYSIPARLIKDETSRLISIGLLSRVEVSEDVTEPALQPAVPVESLTVGELMRGIDRYGQSGFIPGFGSRFEGVEKLVNSIDSAAFSLASETLCKDIPVDITPLASPETPKPIKPLKDDKTI